MKKINLIACGLLVMGFIASCRKDATNETTPTLDKLQVKPETLAAITTIPSNYTGGMKNYESFYTSKVDGQKHGYIISTPLDYDPNTSTVYPLLVFLHGDGEKPNGEYDLGKLKAHGPHKEIYQKSHKFPGVVASLQMERWAGDWNVKVVKEFMDILAGNLVYDETPGAGYGLGKYNINLNNIGLTGLSKGGAGVYGVAATYPEFLASASVFAGFTWGPADMAKIKAATYIRHNSGDWTVNVNNAYNAQSWINAANPSQKVNFNIFNAGGHDSWSAEYARTDASSVYDFHFKSVKGEPISNVGNPAPAPAPTPVKSTTSSVIVQPAPAPAPVPAPVVSSANPVVATYTPSQNSTLSQLSGYQTISIKYNKNVVKGSGKISVKNLTDNTSFDVYPNWGMVSVNATQVNIYPVLLLSGKKYSVRIAAGAFKDESGNAFEGIADDTTWTFETK